MTPVKPNENHIGQKVWWRSSGTETVGMIRGFIPARSELAYASRELPQLTASGIVGASNFIGDCV